MRGEQKGEAEVGVTTQTGRRGRVEEGADDTRARPTSLKGFLHPP
jgi:hypothetical protein